MPRFHVRHRNVWEPTGDGSAFHPRLPGRDTVVGRFATFADADAERGRLEFEARARANPFRMYGPTLFYQTSLDRPRLIDFLLDHDLPLPADAADGRFSFAQWFDRVSGTFTDTHWAAVWSACDKVRFYEVTEDNRSAYAVLELVWGEWEGDTIRALPEGGKLVGLHADPRTAQKQAERLTRRLQEEPPFGDEFPEYDIGESRTGDSEIDGPTPPDETAFHEVIECPLDGPRPAYLVSRPGYEVFSGEGYSTTYDGDYPGARVPVRAFADRTSAEAFRAALEADARRTVNPFRLVESSGHWSGRLFAADEDRLPNGRTLDAAELFVRQLGLDPPADLRDWLGWYDRVAGELSAEMIAAIWEAFAGFRLFEVQAAP